MIYDVRGSMFMDLGAVWDNDDITLSERGTLKDLKCGIGFGPRLNFGYFVIKLDVAWETDTENFSRPSYYFTLSPDF
jgi:outer membrane translocation and assembly module TamA